MILLLRAAEGVAVIIALFAAIEGIRMVLSGRWQKRWRWVLRHRPDASGRLFGVGLLAVAFELAALPVLVEARALQHGQVALAWLILAAVAVPLLFTLSYTRARRPVSRSAASNGGDRKQNGPAA